MTAEGRTRAQANGVRFGRKPSLTAYQRAEALRRRAAGETLVEIARSFNVSHMTIYEAYGAIKQVFGASEQVASAGHNYLTREKAFKVAALRHSWARHE